MLESFEHCFKTLEYLCPYNVEFLCIVTVDRDAEFVLARLSLVEVFFPLILAQVTKLNELIESEADTMSRKHTSGTIFRRKRFVLPFPR